MQTREELTNDLIEALQISNAYQRRQEKLWKEQVIRDCEYHTKKAVNN